MRDDRLTGTAIREIRLRSGMRQVELARKVGISASYFNQIEHNSRRIGGKLLSDIAVALGVDMAALAEGANARLIEVLRDAQASEPGIEGYFSAPEDFAVRFPAWGRLLATRHRKVQALDHLVDTLTDRLAHDRQLGDTLHEILSTVTAICSSAGILMDEPDLEPAWRDRFQRNIILDSARLARGAQALVDYLDTGDTARARVSAPMDEVDAFLTHHAHHFPDLEGDDDRAIDTLVATDMRLISPQAKAMAKDHLAAYRRDAARIPLDRATAAIARCGLDPLAIAREVGADLATTLRRLAAMPDDLLPSPVGLAICDASGTLILRKQVEGFSLPRHGGACPLWPLFQSLTQPLRPICRTLQQSGRDRGTVVTYTVSAPEAEVGLDGDMLLRAHMLILPQANSPGKAPPDTSVRNVGLTCRICVVDSCRARREPSILT